MDRIVIKVAVGNQKTTEYKKHIYTDMELPDNSLDPSRILGTVERRKMVNKNHPGGNSAVTGKCWEELLYSLFLVHPYLIILCFSLKQIIQN